MVYDSCARRSIVFGGVGPVPAEVTNNETWSYDYDTNSWAFLGPSGAPSVRAWHGMVYVEGDDDDQDGPRHGTRGARDDNEDCDDDDDRDKGRHGTGGRRDDKNNHEAVGRTILFGGAATRTGPATDDL